MKKSTLFALPLTLSLTLVACGGASTSNPPAKSVNDVTLTVKQLNVPLAGFDAGNSTMRSIMVGNNIYFANDSNTSKAQFFVRYDIASNTFSAPLAKSSNVCGCGYMSKLVSDGTNIFYIANEATKYTTPSNSWATLTYPNTVKDNAGEAGTVYLNNNIYFLGGRTPSTLFKYYNISQDKWFTGPNYTYATNRIEMVAYKDRILALGGTGTYRKVSLFNTTSGTWATLKDAPFDINTNYNDLLSATLGNYLYLLQDKSIYVYDIANDIWANAPLSVTGLGSSSNNLFSNGSKLYISGKSSSNVPQVYEITPVVQ